MIKRITALTLATAFMLGFAGCGKEEESVSEEAKKYLDSARTEFNDALDLTSYDKISGAPSGTEIFLEAENAELLGGVKLANPQYPGYTGDGYVNGFATKDDKCVFTAEIAASGSYDITFNSAMGAEGSKINFVYVDDEQVGELLTDGNLEFKENTLSSIYLEKGTRKISVGVSWGYIDLDNMTIKPSSAITDNIFSVDAKLSNPNASEQTRKLMNFLTDAYGKYIISGQYCDDGADGAEIRRINEKTGKKPAMLGLDLMDYSTSRIELGGAAGHSIEEAMEWWYINGGIVTMCWHWNAPTKYVINSEAAPWYKAFYKECTTINLDKIMNGEDEEGYQLLLNDIEAISKELKRLDDANVPIIWRPLHEASGGWFWWGNCSPESYKKLWNLMYDKMTNEYEVNNLIWVWNGQSADWYPGDETVDVIGWDIYAGNHVYTSQSGRFTEMAGIAGKNKLLAMTENGTMFDPELAFRDNARWAWFCTWGGEFVIKLTIATEDYTEFDMWKKVYNSDRVLTLDEMPNLREYAADK